MSIRRVSELPSIENDNWDEDNLRASFMELSYKLSSGNESYGSRKIKFDDITNSIDKFFNTSVDISGDFYVNKSDFPNDYITQINSLSIEFNSSTPIKFNTNGVISGLSILNDPVNGKDAVNLEYLNTKLEELCAYLDDEINNLYLYEPPYLNFIASDRVLPESDWKIGGSTVLLSQYPGLSTFVVENQETLEHLSVSGNNTWGYTLNKDSNGNLTSIILPKSTSFIQFTNNTISAGKYVDESLPNISGEIVCHNSKGVLDKEPLSYTDKCTTNGAFRVRTGKLPKGGSFGSDPGSAISAIIFNANSSNSIYKNGAHVQPKANLFIPYFYVGKSV